MKINDIIYRFPCPSVPSRSGICRLRTFVNSNNQIIALLTDLYLKNTGASITNSIELIYSSLIEQGYFPVDVIFIEHYESNLFPTRGRFNLVIIDSKGYPEWTPISKAEVIEMTECGSTELDEPTLSDPRLRSEIEKLRTLIDPHIDLPYQQSSKIITRRIKIDNNKISKQSISDLVNSNASENEFRGLLKKDLSIFGELYASPADDYICFSEFPVNDGFVDFAIFTGTSYMTVILIEIKGADFFLFNKGHYDKFNWKIDIAIAQIRDRLGFIHRNINDFKKHVHTTRLKVESGVAVPNSFIGPCELLQVDKNKDIYTHCVVIGGRTRDDLKESQKRHDFQDNFKLPIKIESWDTWIRKIRRR